MGFSQSYSPLKFLTYGEGKRNRGITAGIEQSIRIRYYDVGFGMVMTRRGAKHTDVVITIPSEVRKQGERSEP